MLAGRVDYYFCPLGTALPFIQDGRVLALAVSTPKRAAALPDVPTTLEAGFSDSDYTFWIRMFAPAKTPPDIINKFQQAATKALQTASLPEKLAKLGVEPMLMSPAEFDSYVKREIITGGAFAKAAGLKAN